MSQQAGTPTAAMASLSIADPDDVFIDVQVRERIDLPGGSAYYDEIQWIEEIVDVLTICDLPYAVPTAVLERDRNDIARGIVANKALKSPIAVEEITPHATLFRFISAAFDGNAEALKALIPAEEEDRHQQEHEGLLRGALFMAVIKNRVDAVAALLDAGVDANRLRDEDGRTAVCHATQDMREAVLRLLLARGAKVDIMARDGRTAFHRFGASVEHEGVVRVLIEFGADVDGLKGNGEPELYCHAAGGNVEGVRQLLKLGADPSRRTTCRWCPLHWAAQAGHFEVVRLLVEAGADINNQSDTGRTPLDLLEEARDLENDEMRARTREYLVEHGARKKMMRRYM